ncbi:TetR family transcriptional regulator [Kribbella sp. VKM Ac-2571]|uniref:TetR/AcrR family transcriptional regulator n=1 Tax=Kribbella sp. VKM Ac-2571 TaxID=2512222 RepID=UPI00105ECA05|nr:TetR/AcrR family transcriptional regulator [Kribbella sp. VKM Ac-2571]TDO68223.1 TetR family transcriptional regulator [Kribbella sp. VKM Ac-2571]
MARWDPGAELRLRKAALELYAEHGYDAVTVNQIAEHAGLTRRSYFRYFPDKREVLFAGSERLPAAVTEAIRAVDPSVAPWPAVLQTAVAIGELLADVAEDTDVRRAVIAASPELQERERTKLASVTAALRDGLEERGLPAEDAALLAQVGSAVLQNAFSRWIDAGGKRSFRSCLDVVVESLRGELDH